MEEENDKNEANNVAKDLAKSQSSERIGPNILKVRSDTAKSMAKSFLKTRKAIGISVVPRIKQKKRDKSVSQGSKATEYVVEKLILNEENLQKDATSSTEHVDKSHQILKNEENICASDGEEKGGKSNDSPKKRRRGKEPVLLDNNQKIRDRRDGKRKTNRNELKEKHINTEKNSKDTKEHGGKEKKEKIGGLIFMCNAKTKPDCFRYHVFGVSAGKKDLILGIKRGLKLFLYDYDLKLMYGIYMATSSGGMKLEPKAFGGAFPAQVRFSVHADCFPLAESIFKKAIKENYNEKNKFRTELTARQVRKLTELFRPVAVQLNELPAHFPSRAVPRILQHPESRESHNRQREARAPSDREVSARDSYANINATSYSLPSRERDQQIAHGELASIRRQDINRDLYLSEKEYRTYGLQGERRNLTLQHHDAPRFGSYQRDTEEQPVLRPDRVFTESVPMHRDRILPDSFYLTEREYQTYDLAARREMQSSLSAPTGNPSAPAASTLDSYAKNPYYSRCYGASLVDSYLRRPRDEACLIEPDHLGRRESNQVDRLYSTYASDALADYNQLRRYQDAKHDVASTSVSSRYSFAGPSLYLC